MAKFDNECRGAFGLQKEALVSLSNANQFLREEVISLMLDIASLREKSQRNCIPGSDAISTRRSTETEKSTGVSVSLDKFRRSRR
jgi:hypothetical protein